MHVAQTRIVSALLFSALSVTSAIADNSFSKTTEWSGIRIQCNTTGGKIRCNTSSEECHIRMDFENGITHSLFLKSDVLLLSSGALGIDRKQFEVEGCTRILVAATRDTLMLKYDKRSSSSSSSLSSSSTRSGPTSISASSSSVSTSISSDVKSFDIATWNGKKIELSLKGGNSVESTIERNGEQCNIEFSIDKGKNKRTISVRLGSLTIDGKQRHTGDEYSELVIDATRDSLDVKTDRTVIGRWKGDMGKKVLRD